MPTAGAPEWGVTSFQVRVGRSRVGQQITIYVIMSPHIIFDSLIDAMQDKDGIADATGMGTSALTSGGPRRPPRACIPRGKSLTRIAIAEDEWDLPDRANHYLNDLTYGTIDSKRFTPNERQMVGSRGRNCSAACADKGPRWVKFNGSVTRKEPMRGSASVPTMTVEPMDQLQLQWTAYTIDGTTVGYIAYHDIKKEAKRTPADKMGEHFTLGTKPADYRRAVARTTVVKRGRGSRWTLLDGRRELTRIINIALKGTREHHVIGAILYAFSVARTSGLAVAALDAARRLAKGHPLNIRLRAGAWTTEAV